MSTDRTQNRQRLLLQLQKLMQFQKRSTIIVLIVTVICCLAMALVDGVIRPGYAVKSVIKIALFMLIPLIASRLDRSVLYLQLLRP